MPGIRAGRGSDLDTLHQLSQLRPINQVNRLALSKVLRFLGEHPGRDYGYRGGILGGQRRSEFLVRLFIRRSTVIYNLHAKRFQQGMPRLLSRALRLI